MTEDDAAQPARPVPAPLEFPMFNDTVTGDLAQRLAYHVDVANLWVKERLVKKFKTVAAAAYVSFFSPVSSRTVGDSRSKEYVVRCNTCDVTTEAALNSDRIKKCCKGVLVYKTKEGASNLETYWHSMPQ